jgi:hypothetical protein
MFIGVVVALMLVLLRRHFRTRKIANSRLTSHRENLVKQIIELDIAYEAKGIPPQKYEQIRTQLKQNLFMLEAERNSFERFTPD